MDMKCDKSEMTDAVAEGEGPDYPYGLRLHLGEEELKKLGFTELPEVGDKVVLMAVSSVCGIFSSTTEEGGLNRSVDLQITDLEITREKKPQDKVKLMYGEHANDVKMPPGTKVVPGGYF